MRLIFACTPPPTPHPPPAPSPIPNYAEAARNMELCPLFPPQAPRRALTQQRRLCVHASGCDTNIHSSVHTHADMHTATCARASTHAYIGAPQVNTRDIPLPRKTKRRQSRFHGANPIPIFSAVMNLYHWHTSLSFPGREQLLWDKMRTESKLVHGNAFFFQSDAVKTKPISRY